MSEDADHPQNRERRPAPEWDGSREAADYTPTENFIRKRRRGDLRGIFPGPVIRHIFEAGEAFRIPNVRAEEGEQYGEEWPAELTILAAEIDRTYLGLLLDEVNGRVLDGAVLQVSPSAETTIEPSTNSLRLWDGEAVERMRGLAAAHEGAVVNAFRDPTLGSADRWTDDRAHEHPAVRFNLSTLARRRF